MYIARFYPLSLPGLHGPPDATWGREEREKWGILYTPEGNSTRTETIATIPGDYRLFCANVRDAILGNALIDVTHEQMLNVMEALESARESSSRRCTVAFPRKIDAR